MPRRDRKSYDVFMAQAAWAMEIAQLNPFWLMAETRSVAELGAFFASTPWLKRVCPEGTGQPVLVLPGMTANDGSTQPMRALLREIGYRAHGWRQGRNMGLRPGLFQALRDRVNELSDRYGEPVSVVGWSLGGTFGRELARVEPDHIRQVITLGSPFADARVNPFSPIYRTLGGGAPPAALFRLFRKPLSTPATSIYSRTDGIVDWRTSLNPPGPLTENIEVFGSHIGLVHNPTVFLAVCDRLSQTPGDWRPFRRSGERRLLYPVQAR